MIRQLLETTAHTHSHLWEFLYYASCGGFSLLFLLVFRNKMPQDQGRAFAVNGEKSKGKARGVGILFILAFVIATFLFVQIDWEAAILLVLILASMLTGFLDDAGSTPWGGLKKGLLDLAISVGAGFTAWYFYGSELRLHSLFAAFNEKCITLPVWLYIILAAALVWASINVVNCTDGVDGLCTTLSILALTGFAVCGGLSFCSASTEELAIGMICVLLPYLWFNASPSSMLMGDAGSRALGLFLAMIALRSGYVLLYIPFCLIFLLDGGLGLLKLALLRSVKIHILKNTRTPLHDHARKNKGWSDTQTVLRFAIIQALILIVTVTALWSCK
ncbi:MAG: phospho-N-acetylmuramoyl-pentapeptide-transferase [Lachnospiraceae bacterium]|nr:phospho-N-acetylmuramoyl-pentapeptide-transferase [Lachnospiraceae bacterium]